MIPVMDDPLGKHWQQPEDIREVVMDETHVLLTPQQLGHLAEYNTTRPSGVYPGKCWKTWYQGAFYLVWYGDETPDKKCPILNRRILVVH